MHIKSPAVVFVVIGYKPVKEALSSLLWSFGKRSVIVVNNGRVRLANNQLVRVIGDGRNLGYSAGANLGMKEAFGMGALWVVICNQDLFVTPKAVESLVTTLATTSIGIAGPFAGGLDPNRMTTILPSEKADYITGSCIAIHKTVYETIGNFYEPYFLYYEEVDYCVRAKRKGFAITHLPVDGIIHEENNMLGNNTLAHQYYLSRNHLLIVKKLALSRVKCYEFIRMPLTIFEHIVRRQWGALQGIRDFFLGRFGLKERV